MAIFAPVAVVAFMVEFTVVDADGIRPASASGACSASSSTRRGFVASLRIRSIASLASPSASPERPMSSPSAPFCRQHATRRTQSLSATRDDDTKADAAEAAAAEAELANEACGAVDKAAAAAGDKAAAAA